MPALINHRRITPLMLRTIQIDSPNLTAMCLEVVAVIHKSNIRVLSRFTEFLRPSYGSVLYSFRFVFGFHPLRRGQAIMAA